MDDGYKPVIHWVTRREIYERQEMLTVRESRPTHADPTAAAAIGRVERETERMRRKRNNVIQQSQLKTRVWRQDEAGMMGVPGLQEASMKGEP